MHPDSDDLFPVPDATLAALSHRLAGAAARDGLLDVAYRELDSPVGTLLVAGTERGLLRIAFRRNGFDDVLAELADRVSPRLLLAPARLDDAARQLGEYFAGTRHTFDLPLDRRLSSGFRGAVHLALDGIDYGRTTTYAQLAALLGNPKAVRAVGTACATNPLPVVVPCHRVVRSDGSLGGYAGGGDAKAVLLALERTA